MKPEAKKLLETVRDWFEEDPTRWDIDAVQIRKPETPEMKVAVLSDLVRACPIGAICAAEWQLYPDSAFTDNCFRYEAVDALDEEITKRDAHMYSIVEFGRKEGLPGFVELVDTVIKEGENVTTVS